MSHLDVRKPEIRWRLYIFKGGEVLNVPLYVHSQSCYLFGRERRVADIPTDHPSCSKQHSVLQYRLVKEEKPDGTMSKRVRPYLMDLGSTNGTSVSDERIEPQRYYELFEKDTIKFGNSSCLLIHPETKDVFLWSGCISGTICCDTLPAVSMRILLDDAIFFSAKAGCNEPSAAIFAYRCSSLYYKTPQDFISISLQLCS